MAEVVDYVDTQGHTIDEAAAHFGITKAGIYGHLRKGGHARGAKTARRARRAGTSTPVVQLPEAHPIPAPPFISNGNGTSTAEAVDDVRTRIADIVENMESTMTLKRAEITTLERQHKTLMQTLSDLAAA